MKILAIDCGTKTGFALYSNGIMEGGVQDFSLKRGESVGMRFVRFRSWLQEMLQITAAAPLDLVVYEQAHHRGGSATEVLVGMVTRIQEECDQKNINYTSVHSATLKKFATGKGNAGKEQMLAEARRRFGDEVEDHNEADARLMVEWARKEFN